MSLKEKVFWQLFILYTIITALILGGFLSSYVLEFQLFALIIAILGYTIIQEEEKLPSFLVIIAVLFVIAVRVIPYLNNTVPLGYDPGLYTAYFDGTVDWFAISYEPVLKFLVSPLLSLGNWFVLAPVFIIFNALLCFLVYMTVREWFSESSAIFASLIFAVSYTQYLSFWYLYYKNIVGLCFLLLALFFYARNSWIMFIIFGGLLGGLHRPTFLIFFLSLIFYTLFKRREYVRDFILYVGVLIIALSFYVNHFKEMLLPGLEGISTLSIGPGTFIDFQTFTLFSLAYLPLSLLGIIACIKKKQFTPFLFSYLICFIIVFFSLIFYHRFIIHLDLIMVIFAGIGAASFPKRWIIFILILISAVFVVHKASITEPLLTLDEFKEIQQMKLLGKGYVMSTDRYYSPWLLGYSGHDTIAPGMFEHDLLSYDEWVTFWTSDNTTQMIRLLQRYDKPIYIYLGNNMTYKDFDAGKFQGECFEQIGKKVVKFMC